MQDIKDDAVEALLDTLGAPEPEPEDPTPVVEVSEVQSYSFLQQLSDPPLES